MTEIRVAEKGKATEAAMKLAHELTQRDWINFDNALDVLLALDRLGYKITKQQN